MKLRQLQWQVCLVLFFKKMVMSIFLSMMGFPTLGLSQKWPQKRNDTFYKLWLERWHLSSLEFSKLSIDVSCCCHMMVPFWHFVALYTCENSVIMLTSCHWQHAVGLCSDSCLVRWKQQNGNNADAGGVLSFWPSVIKLCKNCSILPPTPNLSEIQFHWLFQEMKLWISSWGHLHNERGKNCASTLFCSCLQCLNCVISVI